MKQILFLQLLLIIFTVDLFSQNHQNQELPTQSNVVYDTVDVTKWHSYSMSLNRILNQTSGVHVREDGSIGGDFSYMLNGVSDNSIAFCIDGIPTNNMGRSLAISTLNPAFVEKIEIYKGINPVGLGTDALGGTINIITKKSKTSFIDASYSMGSFNTHQAHIQGQWVNQRNGLTAKLASYYTASENNYYIWGMDDIDRNTGQIIEITKGSAAQRFNNDVNIAHAKVEVGVTNKKWTDALFVGLTTSMSDKGVPNDNDMRMPFGKVRSENKFVMPTLKYKKENLFLDGLSLDIYAAYSMNTDALIDTSMYRTIGMETLMKQT